MDGIERGLFKLAEIQRAQASTASRTGSLTRAPFPLSHPTCGGQPSGRPGAVTSWGWLPLRPKHTIIITFFDSVSFCWWTIADESQVLGLGWAGVRAITSPHPPSAWGTMSLCSLCNQPASLKASVVRILSAGLFRCLVVFGSGFARRSAERIVQRFVTSQCRPTCVYGSACRPHRFVSTLWPQSIVLRCRHGRVYGYLH
jgi:hypothetical protein